MSSRNHIQYTFHVFIPKKFNCTNRKNYFSWNSSCFAVLYTPYSKMAETWKKLARVARKRGHKGQFGWNKNKKVNQSTLRHNCHFSSLSNRFSLPQNMQNSKETTLGPYDLVFVQLVPVFFKWQPFLNKVYSYTTIFHILHELILIIYYKLCAHLFSNIVYQLGYTVKDIHVHVLSNTPS